MGMPERTMCSGSGPVMDMPPPMACATWSKAGRFGFGPSDPKPVTVQVMMPGLMPLSVSKSMPRRSGTPTPKLLITTSASRTRS